MEKVKLTARTIRYYDSEGMLGDVKRSVGYTRYFTENEVERLNEIKKLKKRGLKIAEIKVVIKEKYKQTITNSLDGLEIPDIFLTESDITICQDLNIDIASSIISFGKIKTPYLNWKDIAPKMYEDPFSIKSNFTAGKQNATQLKVESNKSSAS